MILCTDIGDMWSMALDLCMKEGFIDNVRQGGHSRRVLGFAARILRPRENILICEKRKFSVRYGCGEFVWYLTQHPTLEQIMHYAPSYNRFADDDYGFYGKRLGGALQLAALRLIENPHDRRVVTSMWESRDLLATKKDIPCTLNWQWLVVEGRLNMISTMRSNDVWLGMPNDVFVNTCVQQLMCCLTGYKMGWYQHQVGDMHLYEKDWDVADSIFENEISAAAIPRGARFDWDMVEHLITKEWITRDTGKNVGGFDNEFLDFIYKGLCK